MRFRVSYAAPDQEIHDAVNAADRLLNDDVTTWISWTDLFALFWAAAAKNGELDPDSRLWIPFELRDFILLAMA